MRRSRTLTRAETWELAIFLGLIFMGLLGLTLIWHSGAIPRIAAYAISPGAEQSVETMPLGRDGVGDVEVVEVAPDRSAIRKTPADSASKQAAAKPVAKKTAEQARWYNGEKYYYAKTIRMRVTAYAPDPRCCWPYAGTTTASGLSVRANGGKLVAADTRLLPMHSLVSVPGYHSGQPVPVLDRGGAIKGARLDVLLPTFSQAQAWGARYVDVKVYMPAGN